ncbi:acyl-CoA synthetase (AMP-forming)/AMP-acid ligase II [Saccharothrix tamanrassetensis]|uniref:Acyl-CoA synthetase (AMP-forming)/AMP-acid ligase II n=1 Tax=Saccharothrix tamanrassetensis TaxID=1051531 RepID=A0A841CP76_9PSEU|nr:fatty acyl-AMP ligase [Saccharothrix tamanrassetensis]MBB5957316.1 acyl-CoA synthetase (AMP-forming)/AMP-acid ligase II [Saccharothrix tamanrassetensis]
MTDFVTRFRAHPRSDRKVTHLPDGRPAAELTHLELDRKARAVACRLTGSGMAGRPVLLLYPAGLDFLVAFLGCLYAGAVAVPAPLPLSGASRVDRVDRLIEDSGARLVLTDEAHVTVLSGLSARTFDETAAPDSWEPPEVDADTVAYLQYTSGSTSRPRGVEVTHGSLTHNLELFGKISGDVPVRRIGGWLPHHHDMGLVGLQLQALHAEADLVLLSPEAVVARPIRWLRAISDHRVDWTVSPDFGYAWTTRRVGDAELDGLDLSCLTMAVSGAEPIRIATLDAFADRFASVGFRRTALSPGYGLAESTLVVTCTSRGLGPTVRSFTPASLAAGEVVPTSAADGVPLVGCGEPGDMRVRVVDPATGVEVGDGTIGEIRVAGPSLAAGYHGDPAATRATFVTGPDGRWLRTGDLGFLLDGQLYVTGRLKELIIVRGRNLYPQDIEFSARGARPDAGRGAAFGVRDADSGEHVVLVQELRRASQADAGEFADAVLDAIAKQFGVAVSIVVVRPSTVCHTTSGKVRRGHMRELFLDGGLSALHSVLTPAVAAIVTASEETHV